MRKKWNRGFSMLLAALLAAGPFGTMDFSVKAESGTLITESEMEELLSGNSQDAVTVRSRQSVHDPSVVTDNGTYYVFGSHMGAIKSTDLSNWQTVYADNGDGSQMFADAAGKAVTYDEAFADNAYKGTVKVKLADGAEAEVNFGTYNAAEWIQDNTVSGNMWAPDVIYNTAMDQWCMYLSLNGAKWDSCILLLTADDIEGPYVYQGPVVFTGFSTADSADSFHNTDLELVLGELSELPEKYRQRTDESKGNWGTWWPHAIDPAVFYDDQGKLWMTYGSWSGGICMLKLDEQTGLRDYTVTYESNSDTLGKNYTSDAYFGKRIAGGHYVSGEGPYIEKIGDYYYLFVSYGFYDPNGGYNMRIFRSEHPDGPYVDANGNSALYDKYVLNYASGDMRGEKLMASYKWDTMDKAETAQGHNSAFVDSDGKAYVVYHTKFADKTADHEIRVHQLFQNEDGWLVAAPYEYGGETLAKTGWSNGQITGEYDVILHPYAQDYVNLEYETPSQITLHEDGTITGAYTGTWGMGANVPQITMSMDGHTFKGVLIEQKVDNEPYTALCFTAADEDGRNLWGSKAVDEKHVIARNVKSFDFGVPESTVSDLSLKGTGSGGALITWTSSNPGIINEAGKITSSVAQDTAVTLTASISKGGYYYKMDFPITIKAGNGTFTERTLIASYFTDQEMGLTDKLDGSLYVNNPFYEGTNQGMDISGGVSMEFDITRTGEVHALGTVLAFLGSGRLFFTPGSYLGYNAKGGYFDANIKDYKLVRDYIGEGAHVTLSFLPDGFSMAVNGEIVYDQEITGTENGSGTLNDYSDVQKWLQQSADKLYFGYGSFWSENGSDEAECSISNVKCYVEASAKSSNTTAVWYEKDEVVLSSNDQIAYEENPFYGQDTDSLYLEYTINFASDAAKNGWDGIFSFYNTKTTGRLSVQTNPYLCFNAADGFSWADINNPNNTANGGTNWAASAETGRDYRITMRITKDSAAITVDGQELAFSVASANADYETILNSLSSCDKLTWGVGYGETSYWYTELCTLKDITIASSPYLQKEVTEKIVLSGVDFLQTRMME